MMQITLSIGLFFYIVIQCDKPEIFGPVSLLGLWVVDRHGSAAIAACTASAFGLVTRRAASRCCTPPATD